MRVSLPPLGHPVAGIDAEVEEGLADLVGVSGHRRQLGGLLGFWEDSLDGFGKGFFKQFDQAFEQVVGVGRLPVGTRSCGPG